MCFVVAAIILFQVSGPLLLIRKYFFRIRMLGSYLDIFMAIEKNMLSNRW